jgi:hypothetical protein
MEVPNTLTVWSSTNTTGSHHVRLEHPGGVEQFAVNVGDTVKADSAGSGSGNIEDAGGSDRYNFDAPASGYVSLAMVEHSQRVALGAPTNACSIVRSQLGVDARLVGAAELVLSEALTNPAAVPDQ